MVYIKLMQIR